VPGCRFIVANDGAPSVIVPLGEMEGLVTLRSLANEFDFTGTDDANLLEVVESSLRFVKTIYPGDSIPREILDGTASWSVKDHHFMIANGRLTMQLSSWFTGKEEAIPERAELMTLVNDPMVKARVNQAVDEIAGHLGLPLERRHEVMTRIEAVSRELAYIEALRERFGLIRNIRSTLQGFAQLYRRDRSFAEELLRIDVLIRKPIDEFSFRFDQVDAQCGEVVALLKNLDLQITFIRSSRDDLHTGMMPWDPVIETWEAVVCLKSDENEAKIRKLYQFLASRYSLGKAWKLTNRPGAAP